MESLLESDLTDARTLAFAGFAASSSSDHASAIEHFDAAATAASHALLSLLCLESEAAVCAGDWGAARTASAAAVRAASGESAEASYWLGRAQLGAGHARLAAPSFKTAVDLTEDAEKKTEYVEWLAKCEKAAPKTVTVDVSTRSSPPAPKAGQKAYASVAPAKPKVVSRAESTPTPAHAVFDDGDDDMMKAASTNPPPPPPDARMEWYQSPGSVSIDVYAKNVDKTSSSVEITANRVVARLVRPDKVDYVLERDLFGEIDPANSSWSANKFKVEIKLKKTAGSGEWKALERAGVELSATERARLDREAKIQAIAAKQKNWDKIVTTELAKEKEESGPMDVFKTIYADADDDVRRAMMKSYSESGGKVLSTDWKDVGSRKVTYESKD
jgi:SGS domain/CS domain